MQGFKKYILVFGLSLTLANCEAYMHHEIDEFMAKTNKVLAGHLLNFLDAKDQKDSEAVRTIMTAFTEDVAKLKKEKEALHEKYEEFTIKNHAIIKKHSGTFSTFQKIFSALIGNAADYINARPQDIQLKLVAEKANKEFLNFFHEKGLKRMKTFFRRPGHDDNAEK